MVKDYINIHVKLQLNRNELKQTGLMPILNNDLFAELYQAYEEDLNQSEHLTSRKVEYYKRISYTILDDDNQIDIKLKVGDVIDLEDLSTNNISPNSRLSYAQIKAIFLHVKGNVQVPFLLLDWFISQDTIDQKLKCPLYKLQKLVDYNYTQRHIYAIKWIDHQPNIHFVHCCQASCANGNHSQDNMYYMHNIFYYTAV